MSSNSSNPTTGFIDLATYDQLEKALYGVENVVTYFVRETVRSTWFTQVPVKLNLDTASPSYGNTFNATVSRAGDYLLNAWLRVTLDATIATAVSNSTLAWTPNFMHNLVQKCKLTFNDMTAAEFYSEHLDFWTAFMIPASKRAGYNRMIGNFAGYEINNGTHGPFGGSYVGAGNLNQDVDLYLPLPFFFSRDSGVSLPTAALPYNEIKMEFTLRNSVDLIYQVTDAAAEGVFAAPPALTSGGTLSNVQVWANYALVSNNERKKMGCAPRDIVIEQSQMVGGSNGGKAFDTASTTTTTQVDLRLAHAVKALFFGAKRTPDNGGGFRSCYDAIAPKAAENSTLRLANQAIPNILFPATSGDPIGTAKLMYENTTRMELDSSYYNLIQGYNHGVNTPSAIPIIEDPSSWNGMHMYSYALDVANVDPCGSTNYGKLTNVSLVFTPSSLANSDPGEYQLYVTAVNHNVVRISGGALGFPVL